MFRDALAEGRKVAELRRILVPPEVFETILALEVVAIFLARLYDPGDFLLLILTHG